MFGSRPGEADLEMSKENGKDRNPNKGIWQDIAESCFILFCLNWGDRLLHVLFQLLLVKRS